MPIIANAQNLKINKKVNMRFIDFIWSSQAEKRGSQKKNKNLIFITYGSEKYCTGRI